MKRVTLFLSAFICLCTLHSCHKTDKTADANIPDCVQQKIEQFKLQINAQSVILIKRPGDPLYWFVDTSIDAGEVVINENCETVCVTDCECGGAGIVFCDEQHFNYPQETIWEK